MITLFLAMLAATGVQDEFTSPESANLGFPLIILMCGGETHAALVQIEFKDGRNRFDIFQSKGGKKQDVSDQIGGVQGNELGEGKLDLRLRPRTTPDVELRLAIRSNQPLTGTLVVDGGNTRLDCHQMPSPPEKTK